MKYAIWILGAMVLVFAASCSLLNPTANQVTVEVSNQSGSSCPVTVNLDGNNGGVIATGSSYTFPLVSSGSHTLNFSTGGSCSGSCQFTNNNTVNYSTTFPTTGGNVYVGTIKVGGNCSALLEQGP
jgi:hypothetical protein